jgi:hypothetical protein
VTLHSLTVPDDTAELPDWLERQLMAPDFGTFIAELSALFPTIPGIDPPRHLLDKWQTVALTDGLRPIPPNVLTQLLKHPQLLAALQERIALDGGTYWDAVSDRSDQLRAPFERGRQALDQMLAADTASKLTNTANSIDRASRADPKPANWGHGWGYKSWAVISTGVAASLAVAVGILALRQPQAPTIPKPQIAWGWAKPGGLADDLSNPKDYLNKLAANVEEWSLYRPSDPTNLGVRIAEFRTGCTRLIHSPYAQLTPADKAWLLEHCRTWAKELDGQLQALDRGADALAVRASVDETVRSVTAALREKAQQLK